LSDRKLKPLPPDLFRHQDSAIARGDSRSIFDDVDATVVPARWDTAAKKPNDPMG
jgi:hypothetical protein